MNVNTNKDTQMPINLGNPNELSINDLAKNVIELTSSNQIIHKPLPNDDPLKQTI